MLALLRRERSEPARSPQPGTAQLGELVDQVTKIGRARAARDRGRGAAAAPGRRAGSLPDRAGGAHEHGQARWSRDCARRSEVRRARAGDRGGRRRSWRPRERRRARTDRHAGARDDLWRRAGGRRPPGGRLRGAGAPSDVRDSATIRVLLVDDQALVRGGFRSILEGQDDLQVVGEASDGVEAIEQGLRTAPDVILMDIRMPRLDGIERPAACSASRA